MLFLLTFQSKTNPSRCWRNLFLFFKSLTYLSIIFVSFILICGPYPINASQIDVTKPKTSQTLTGEISIISTFPNDYAMDTIQFIVHPLDMTNSLPITICTQNQINSHEIACTWYTQTPYESSDSWPTGHYQIMIKGYVSEQCVDVSEPITINICNPGFKPLNDTDGDCMPDLWETDMNLDPLNPDDGLFDSDGDGLLNREEFGCHTNPFNPDDDNDGVPAGIEKTLFDTDPTLSDTDADGVDDAKDFDPLNPSIQFMTLNSPDFDHLPNGIQPYLNDNKLLGYVVDSNDPIQTIIDFVSTYQAQDIISTKNKDATLLAQPNFYIKPGEYFGGVLCNNEFPCSNDSFAIINGRYDQPITIQPLIENTVTFRGSMTIRDLQPIENISHSNELSGIYFEDHPRRNDLPPLYIWESDTFTPYVSVNSLHELNRTFASFFYDKAMDRLYIKTSNGLPAASENPSIPGHSIEVIYYDSGIALKASRHIKIQGLSFQGYLKHAITLSYAEHTLISDCTIRMCVGDGILIYSPGWIHGKTPVFDIPAQNHVVHCEVFCFYDAQISQEGAGIRYFNPQRDSTVQNCLIYAGQNNAIRFYNNKPFINTSIQHNVISGYLHMDYKSIPYGNSIQKPDPNIAYMVGNIMTGGGVLQAGRTLFNVISTDSQIKGIGASLTASQVRDISSNCILEFISSSPLFADPVHHDYRIQKNSPLRSQLQKPVLPYTYYTFAGPQQTDYNTFQDIGAYQFGSQAPVLFVDKAHCNDDNDGLSENDAFCTIQSALNAIEKFVKTNHPVTIYVKEGIYPENLDLQSNIIISAYSHDKVFLVNQSNKEIPGITISNQTNITIQDLIIKGFSTGILVNNASHIHLSGNQIVSCQTGLSFSGESHHIRIHENTFAGNEQYALAIRGPVNHMSVMNTLFYHNVCHLYILDQTMLAQTVYFDFNGYYNQDLLVDGDGMAMKDIKNWQKLTGFDSHALTLDPMFMPDPSGVLIFHYSSPYVRAGHDGRNIGHRCMKAFDIQDLNLNGIKDIDDDLGDITPAVNHEKIFDIGSDRASIQWESNYGNSTAMALLGEAENFENKQFQLTTGLVSMGRYPVIHLNGLKPNTEYIVMVGGDVHNAQQKSSSRWSTHYNYLYADIRNSNPPNRVVSGQISFRTLAQSDPLVMTSNHDTDSSFLRRHIYYVNNQIGNDTHSGLLPNTPWKTIHHAAQIASAGDTVLIDPVAVYHEALRPVHQGTATAPLIFMSSDPNKPVILDGRRYFDDLSISSSHLNLMAYPLFLNTCHYVHIEGFLFRNMKHIFTGTAFIHKTNHITIRKCIFEGMRQGSNLGIKLSDSMNTNILDSIFIGHWTDILIESEDTHTKIDQIASVDYQTTFNPHNEAIVIKNCVFGVSHHTEHAAIQTVTMGPSPYTRLAGETLQQWDNKVKLINNIFTSASADKADSSHSIFYDIGTSSTSDHLQLTQNIFWFQDYDNGRTIMKLKNHGCFNALSDNFGEYTHLFDPQGILLNDGLPEHASPYAGYGQQLAGHENIINDLFISVDYAMFQLIPDLIQNAYMYTRLFDPLGFARVGLDLHDSDHDGLGSRFETEWGLDPNNFDSDHDQIPDYYELISGLNPTNPDDAALDQDQDNLTALQEYLLNAQDTDNDGIYETFVGGGPHPFNPDSDGDTIPDGVAYDPTSGLGDIDFNGFCDLKDLILILQTLTDQYHPESIIGVDVNQDDKIGIEEALYVFVKLMMDMAGNQARPVIQLSATEITVYEESAMGIVATVISQDNIPVTLTAVMPAMISSVGFNDVPEMVDSVQGNQLNFYWIPQAGRGNQTYQVTFHAQDQNGLIAQPVQAAIQVRKKGQYAPRIINTDQIVVIPGNLHPDDRLSVNEGEVIRIKKIQTSYNPTNDFVQLKVTSEPDLYTGFDQPYVYKYTESNQTYFGIIWKPNHTRGGQTYTFSLIPFYKDHETTILENIYRFHIQVIDKPIITYPYKFITVTAGQAFDFTIQTQSYSLSPIVFQPAAIKPENAVFDPETRHFYWQTTQQDAGQYHVLKVRMLASTDSSDTEIVLGVLPDDTQEDSGNFVINPNFSWDENQDNIPDGWVKYADHPDKGHQLTWIDNPFGESGKVLKSERNKQLAEANGLAPNSFGWQQTLYLASDPNKAVSTDCFYELSVTFRVQDRELNLTTEGEIDGNNTMGVLATFFTDMGERLTLSKYITPHIQSYEIGFTDWRDEDGCFHKVELFSNTCWRTQTVYLNVPLKARYLTLLTQNTSSGMFYVKHISLRKVPENKNIPPFKKRGKIPFIQNAEQDNVFIIAMNSRPFIGLDEQGNKQYLPYETIKNTGFNLVNYDGANINEIAAQDLYTKIMLVQTPYIREKTAEGAYVRGFRQGYDHYQGLEISLRYTESIARKLNDKPEILIIDGPDESNYRVDINGGPIWDSVGNGYMPELMNVMNQMRNIITTESGRSIPFMLNFIPRDWSAALQLPYLKTIDVLSFTFNNPFAYSMGPNAFSNLNVEARLNRCGEYIRMMHHMTAKVNQGSPKPVLGFGFGVYWWSYWDHIIPRWHTNQFIPFHLQRYQVYNQIVNGAAGIYFYTGADTDLSNIYYRHQWDQISELAQELRYLYDVYDHDTFHDFWEADQYLEAMLKVYQGKIYLIATNPNETPLGDVTVTIKNQGNIQKITALFETEATNLTFPLITAEDNILDYNDKAQIAKRGLTQIHQKRNVPVNADKISFTDRFIDYGVHVYEIEIESGTSY
jgi:hypothetical protein